MDRALCPAEGVGGNWRATDRFKWEFPPFLMPPGGGNFHAMRGEWAAEQASSNADIEFGKFEISASTLQGNISFKYGSVCSGSGRWYNASMSQGSYVGTAVIEQHQDAEFVGSKLEHELFHEQGGLYRLRVHYKSGPAKGVTSVEYWTRNRACTPTGNSPLGVATAPTPAARVPIVEATLLEDSSEPVHTFAVALEHAEERGLDAPT